MVGNGLTGRSALVTGSTGGIGFAIAERLAANGCAVAIHGLAPADDGIALAADLAARHDVAVAYHHADLSSPDGVEELLHSLGQAPDILVNNAVVRHLIPIEVMTPAEWEADLAVNLSAPFHAIRLALPSMRARGWGRIINMSSVYGLFATAGRVGYVTTKTALIGLTRAVAMETIQDGITCNALCPGSTPTPAIEARITAGMLARGESDREAAIRDFLAGKQPTRRFVQPEAVAAMVAFLCSPAGDDITGATLPMDGGWSAS
ncbi:SDR family oxidoreductase [Neoroseomonas lacus]|uniref:Beta-D-hydroxybutyrate dehydrogenase n=1 Tax=Neoroseomonas lacus TaxID=287609 RepID=A0A917L7M9_9PROT|nr:SDR family oxidoreductase [Neoroseomonas lacus]GGJ44479.1 beta-D-hydroxybutyrate dehydrogenase [Neoroseomonas lacus]